MESIAALQVGTGAGAPAWIALLVQPAIMLAGIGLFLRLVVMPALAKLLRSDLAPELEQLRGHHEQLPALNSRVERLEEALTALHGVPVTLERIETNLEHLMQRRRSVHVVDGDAP